MQEQEKPSPDGINERKKLADIEEAAAFLHVPVSWLYDRTRRNAIPLIRLGKYVRFDLEAIAAWAKDGCQRA